MKKKKLNRFPIDKGIRNYLGASVGIGIGTAIASKAAPEVVPAFQTAAGFLPPVGIAVMGRYTLDQLKYYKKYSRVKK